MRKRRLALTLVAVSLLQFPVATSTNGQRQTQTVSSIVSATLPAPEDVLGFRPGDDRKLASWNQIVTYFEKLDQASDRVKFEALGKSTMDAPFVMATISAPENLARLDEYRKIQELLADPRKLGRNRDKKARRLMAVSRLRKPKERKMPESLPKRRTAKRSGVLFERGLSAIT